MVSNIYLNDVCKYLNNYQGTYSCDGIKKPDLTNNISTYIFNLSKLNAKGSHFVAIQINSKAKKVIYFDSFGFPCTNNDILSFIYSVNKKYEYNTKQIQPFGSSYCGIYCLAFVMYHDSNNKNFINFLKMFNSDKLIKNDNIAVNYILHNSKVLSPK